MDLVGNRDSNSCLRSEYLDLDLWDTAAACYLTLLRLVSVLTVYLLKSNSVLVFADEPD